METKAGKFSPALFGLALACFVMPFMSVSCQGQKLVSLTGLQLMTGAEVKPEMPDQFLEMMKAGAPTGGPGQPEMDPAQAQQMLGAMMGGAPAQQVGRNGMAIGAFVCGLAALALTLALRKYGVLPAVLGAAAVVLLIVMKTKAEGNLGPTMGMLQVNFEIGYWLAIVSFCCAAACNGYHWHVYRDQPVAVAAPVVATSAAPVPRGAPVARAYPTFPDGDAATEPDRRPESIPVGDPPA
ncbi:MAG: hypothetical protein KBD01_09320 [Acidobacteria bacterium]|nr:hypothetical protein [Acidobacteriota bacterium]